jgi:GTPase
MIESTQTPVRKSGYVALVGRPNVGKSTLLNRLVGQKVSIVSDKPQTTRRRILGIHTENDVQMVFVDTPGIHRPGFLLNERMMHAVYETLRGVDLIFHLVDASESYGKGERYAMEIVSKSNTPAFLLLNKVDLVNKGKLLPSIEFYSREGDYLEVIPISAARGDNLDVLMEKAAENLQPGEFLFPEAMITDQQERFIVGEMIREKVLANTRQELPYSTAVLVEEFDESRRDEGFVRITATIVVEKPGQKKIVIGRGGKMIRQIGVEARTEIEAFLEVNRIYLDLHVKVIPAWRNREHLLDQIGVSGG